MGPGVVFGFGGGAGAGWGSTDLGTGQWHGFGGAGVWFLDGTR